MGSFYELVEFEKPSRVVRGESGGVTLHGAKLLGTESSNLNDDGSKNRYGYKVRQESAKLYENRPVFADHNRDNSERSVRDKIGLLKNVEARESGTFGDVILAPGALADKVIWAIESGNPGFYSFSHHVRGEGEVEGDYRDITKINHVVSTDLVVCGATTNSMLEGAMSDPKTKAKAEEVKAVEAKTPETKPTPEPEAAPVIDVTALEALQAKIDALEAKAEETARIAAREKLIADSKLPEGVLSDIFVEQVKAADTEDHAKALLEDRRAFSFHQDPEAAPVAATPKTKASTKFDAWMESL